LGNLKIRQQKIRGQEKRATKFNVSNNGNGKRATEKNGNRKIGNGKLVNQKNRQRKIRR